MKPIFKYLLLFFFIAINLFVLYSTVSEKESDGNKSEQGSSSTSMNKSVSQNTTTTTQKLSSKNSRKENIKLKKDDAKTNSNKLKKKKKNIENKKSTVEEKENGIFSYLTSKITGNETTRNQKAANAKKSIQNAKQLKAAELNQESGNYILCGDGIQACPPPKPAGQCKCNAEQSFLSMFNGSM